MNVADLTPDDCRALVEKLTPRQRDVLREVGRHGLAKIAAVQLGMHVHTASWHMEAAYRTMGVTGGAVQAAVIAERAGLLGETR